jgi:hypothetical protein
MPRNSKRRPTLKEILTKISGYFRENWGAPFVIGFMLLLIVTAAFLLIDLNSLTNEKAICVYYALIGGVVLQHVCFLKDGERNGER